MMQKPGESLAELLKLLCYLVKLKKLASLQLQKKQFCWLCLISTNFNSAK